MITEKDTIKCEAIFNDERTHRFLWKRVWDKDKPIATVIMSNPNLSDNVITDTSTALVVNNIARLERYGGVNIVNLYSLLTPKLHFRWNSDEELNDKDNDTYIRKAAEESEVVILAWGRASENNIRIAARAEHVVAMLADLKDKLMVISDGERELIHPLTPSLRSAWSIVPFDSLTPIEYKPKPKKKKAPKEEPTEESAESTPAEAPAEETTEETTEDSTEEETTEAPTEESTETESAEPTTEESTDAATE